MSELNYNINYDVKVVLTKEGADIVNEYYDELYNDIKKYGGNIQRTDPIYKEDDIYETQLWVMMRIFGEHLYCGGKTFFKDNNMILIV